MRSKIKWVTGIALILSGALFIWGNRIEPRLIDEVHHRIDLPDLPAGWESRQVALIADLQIGMWLGNESTVTRIVRRLVAKKPALVLIGGDFIYHPTEEASEHEETREYLREETQNARQLIERAADMVAPLADAGIAVYAVLGNHDYAMETRESLKLPWVARELAAALEKRGIRVLGNRSVRLKPPETGDSTAVESLYLVAIGAHYPDEDHVSQAFADLPPEAPHLTLMHNPESFAAIPAGQAPVAFAGHTHGGQVRLPLMPGWSWVSIVKEGEVHTDGWIRNYGRPGNHLYVNRGIGFSRVPLRINCRPEVTWFTLTAGPRRAEAAGRVDHPSS